MLLLSIVGLIFSIMLVCRAIVEGWWRTYAIVFSYFVLFTAHSITIWLVYWLRPGFYALYYWLMEGLFVSLGFGLIWQVYAAIPERYPGVGQIIKGVAQSVAAVAPLLLALAIILSRRGTVTLGLVERDFRVFQAVLILIVFGLAVYYRIPLSHNLWAVVHGFGLYIAVFIARYTIASSRFADLWAYVTPLAYIAAQIIWLRGLWRYENQAAEDTGVEAEADIASYSSMIRLGQELKGPLIHE